MNNFTSFRKSPVANAFVFSFLLLGISVFLGLLLRFAFSSDLPYWFNYVNVRLAHYNGALLGWLLSSFLLLIVYLFEIPWRKVKFTFYLSQWIIVALMIYISIAGYSPVGIGLSFVHTLATYVFMFRIAKYLSIQNVQFAHLFIYTSFLFYFLSTLGNWAQIPIVMAELKGSALYYGSKQFYLHFIFNGFFVFALIGVLLQLVFFQKIEIPKKLLQRLYGLLLISTIFTFALSVSWSTPHPAIFLINSIGVIVQFFALLVFFKIYPFLKPFFKGLSSLGKSLFLFSLIAFALKILMQSMVVLPYFAEVSYTIRNFVIGFIHLSMLGCFTTFIFAVLAVIEEDLISILGSKMFMITVVLSEIVLFLEGLFIFLKQGQLPYYYNTITIVSVFLVISIEMVVVRYLKIIRLQN